MRLEPLDERLEGDDVGPRPAGAIDDLVALDDAGQRPAQVLLEERDRSWPWPARSPRRRRAARAALSAPGAAREPRHGQLLDALPVDEALRCVALRALGEVARCDREAGADGDAHHDSALVAASGRRLAVALCPCRHSPTAAAGTPIGIATPAIVEVLDAA